MNWIEREFGWERRELIAIGNALGKVFDDISKCLVGVPRTLRPKSWRREFALWLITGAVVAFAVFRPF